MLTSPSIPPLTAVVYSYKVPVFVATFLRAFDSNIPPPPPACSARARVDPVSQQRDQARDRQVSSHYLYATIGWLTVVQQDARFQKQPRKLQWVSIPTGV